MCGWLTLKPKFKIKIILKIDFFQNFWYNFYVKKVKEYTPLPFRQNGLLITRMSTAEVKALYIYTDAQWNSCENQFCIDEPHWARRVKDWRNPEACLQASVRQALIISERGGTADAVDLKSTIRKGVRVQVPPFRPITPFFLPPCFAMGRKTFHRCTHADAFTWRVCFY